MERMNFFTNKRESSEVLSGDNTPKENTKLKENTKPKENTNQLPPAPIQDEEGNLTFSLEGKTYSLNVNSEEERKRVKEEVNTNVLAKYDWFKEDSGEKHWVLYNTEMYEIVNDKWNGQYLHYMEDCDLTPIMPINTTSCYMMFSKCKSLTQLDLSNFDTRQVTTMINMFCRCYRLTQLDLSSFDTHNVTRMNGMFSCCESLNQLDLNNFDTSKVTDMQAMFYYCKNLTSLDISNFDTRDRKSTRLNSSH